MTPKRLLGSLFIEHLVFRRQEGKFAQLSLSHLLSLSQFALATVQDIHGSKKDFIRLILNSRSRFTSTALSCLFNVLAYRWLL